MVEYSPGWCAHYDNLAGQADHAKGTRQRLQRAGVFQLPLDARILDLCCGTGETLRQLRDKSYTNMVGLDLAYDLLRRHGRNLPVAVSDACNPALRSSCLDAAIILTSLHHVKPMENVRGCLESVFHALKPGGRLYLIDHHDGPWMRMAILFLRLPISRWIPRAARLRKLILSEMDDLGPWLDHWREVLPILEDIGYTVVVFRKAPFHFFLQAERRKEAASNR